MSQRQHANKKSLVWATDVVAIYVHYVNANGYWNTRLSTSSTWR